MSERIRFDHHLARLRWVAVALYVALPGVSLLLAGSAVADLQARRAAAASASELLARLEAAGSAGAGTIGVRDAPNGPPFLEGPTMTIAGAALLQRIAGAVTRVGGNVVSTQVDLQGAQSKAGYISVIASCEVEQPELQKLLYDLEAGMPFLFIDQLVVQAPAAATAAAGQMRVLITVSGQWQGGK